ncbi:Eukaryotic translation initiation factor 3 subunit D [Toxocara canis]|uniref:Eukaryotic translation initiation factor 3 subunit D n=1 Tax=Toxocara canis TaxID=6265 RepID=A0A0B2W2G4_TOXCA|nr:Eukaryotic translation initiation factor 3 subunit D [Toxocara canis]
MSNIRMANDEQIAQLRCDIQCEKAKIRAERNRLKAVVSQGRCPSDATEAGKNRDGWNSVGAAEQLEVLTYQQQLNKTDKIGRVADWIGLVHFGDRCRRGDRNGHYYGSGGGGSEYDYADDDDESTFQLVDFSKPQRSMTQRGVRIRQQQLAYRRMIQKEEERRNQMTYDQNQKIKRSIAKEQQKAFKQWQKRGGARSQGRDRRRLSQWDKCNRRDLPASISVRPEWQVLEEVEFPQLAKLYLPNVEPGQDINGHRYGRLYYYDRSFDKVTVKTERALQHCGGTFYSLTTTEDPIIQQLARENVGNVFSTDIILATLMTATRSVYSWDVIAYRVEDKLFFDKRETTDFSNSVDALTVNETSTFVPQNDDLLSINHPRNLATEAFYVNQNFCHALTVNETSTFVPQNDDLLSINHPRNLATEAFYVNQNFCRTVLKRNDEPFKFDSPTLPFDEEEADMDSCVAYKYRSWSLGQMDDGTEVRLVCRTEHDGVMLGPNGETQTLTIKALNEWDSKLSGGVDWRSKLDTQKGAVLATELQNNSCKLAKWTLQALLADSDMIKFGYVSRSHTRNTTNHVILGTQQSKPTEFASSIALNLDNAWGIVRCIVDLCMKQPAGKYLLLKEPNKPSLSFYGLPEGALESSDEGEKACIRTMSVNRLLHILVDIFLFHVFAPR